MAAKGYGAAAQRNLTDLQGLGRSLSDPGGVDNSHRYRAIFISCLFCAIASGEGYDFGVLNGAIVLMNQDLHCGRWMISLIVTSTPAFMIVGSLCGGWLADTLGRWRTWAGACMMLAVSPLGMALAAGPVTVLLFRSLVGIAIGTAFVAVSMYTSELTPVDLRGKLTIVNEISISAGSLLGFVVNLELAGIENDWRIMVGIGSVIPASVLAFSLCLGNMPESPRWLFARGRTEEAARVLVTYVGKEEARLAMVAMHEQQTGSEKFTSWQDVLCTEDRVLARRLVAGMTVAGSQMLCGYLAVSYYSATVIQESTNNRVAFLITMLMGVLRLIVTINSLFMVESVGRRPMLLTSCSLVSLSLVWLAFAFTLDLSLPVKATGFFLYMGSFSLALGPYQVVYISEVFDTKFRAKCTGLCLAFSRLAGAGTTVVFPQAVHAVGPGPVFAAFAVVSGLLVGMMLRFVPETHGRSLEGMREVFEARGERPMETGSSCWSEPENPGARG